MSFDVHSAPAIMGVINVTPDSFSDGGRFHSVDAGIAHARRLVDEGADILDIGGESTRPGASDVPVQQELDRVIPVIEGIRRELPVRISIDTSKAVVMTEAVKAGATLINDVTALSGEGALQAASVCKAGVCLMHMKGEPRTMQMSPHYDDVVVEVRDYLEQRAMLCEQAGIARSDIMIDPGFGFGKTVTHNLELLASLHELVATGRPVLVGLSRKSMIETILGRPVAQRVYASVGLAVLSACSGAAVIRVHDVAATADALAMVKAVRSQRCCHDKVMLWQ